MDILDQIVERRVAEAALRGDFDELPGAGRPLELDDDALVPVEMRVAYRMMRNAGYVPEEVQLLAEIGSAERLLGHALADDERAAATARVRLLLGRLGGTRGLSLQTEARYFERLVERLESPPR